MPTLHLQDVHLTRGITPVFAGLQLELTEDRIGLIGTTAPARPACCACCAAWKPPTRAASISMVWTFISARGV